MGAAHTMGNTAQADSIADGAVQRRRVQATCRKSSGESSGGERGPIPLAKWTFHRDGIPQAVAHRGYKASFPENTMGAFRGAVGVGAHAIETDVHLSQDGVVVLSHDKDLKRCFGETSLIRDCSWAYLSTLRTVRAPPSPMPRLADLLEYLAEPGMESIWLLLDIKVDDAAEDLISHMANTIAAAPGNADWTRRIVLGCWTAHHMRLCHKLLPDFAIAFIGIRLELAREFMQALPNLAMNMRQEPLFGIGGPRFIRQCQEEGRPLYAWTVNQRSWMQWAIGKKLDCVITDDPKLYLEVARPYRRDREARDGGALDFAEKNKPSSILAAVWDTSFYYLVPILVRMHTLWFGHYNRVGTPAKNREELKQWCLV